MDNTNTPTNIEFLKEQVDKLKSLLDDPQPGLASWVQMYGERMQALSNFKDGTLTFQTDTNITFIMQGATTLDAITLGGGS